jgi:phage terminase large subunit-like protein
VSSRRSLEPFTLEHFKAWAQTVILDDDEPWVLEPFQEAFIEDVFSGVPEAWLVVPEGNGKTTTIAGLALYHCQHRATATVPVAASSREQAGIVYRQAEGLCIRSPVLRPHFRWLEGMRRINCEGMGSRIQIFAADDRTGDGIVPTFCIIDELHRHKDLRLYRTWRGKLGKRNAQIVAISTAGEPGSEFEETRERIRQLGESVERAGCFVRAASPTLILHEWAVPEDADVQDMDVVKAANPFSGVTVESLREKFESPTMSLPHWRRFVCNLPTRSDDAAVQEVEWAAAASEQRIPAGEPVWAGLDVGWKWDTTAFVPFWMPEDTFRLFGPATVLTPPRDGTSLDPNLVEDMLIRAHQRNPLHTVVMDTSRAEQLGEWISSELGAEVIDRQQTNQFAAMDYERFMEALREGWLHHTGDRVLTQHVMNGVARLLPGGGARFDRPAKSRFGQQDPRVIDALIAAAMVHSTAVAGTGSSWVGWGAKEPVAA